MKQSKTEIKTLQEFIDKNYEVQDIQLQYNNPNIPYPAKVCIKGRSSHGQEGRLVIKL